MNTELHPSLVTVFEYCSVLVFLVDIDVNEDSHGNEYDVL